MFASVVFRTGSEPAEGPKRKFSTLSLLVVSVWLVSVIGPDAVGQPTSENAKKLGKSAWADNLYRKLVFPMVPIRQREKTSLCHYEVVTDVNIQRIPDKIDKVLCRKDSCKCAEKGEYKCTQLYTQLNVTYLTENFKLATDFEMIAVEYACVCSKSPQESNINLLEPVIV